LVSGGRGFECVTETDIHIISFLDCSYRASSVRIVIRLPTDATLYFVYLLLYFTLHVSGSHKPIIRGVSSCFLYTTIWFMWCLCCSSACDKPVHRHTQMSNINTAWTKWLCIRKQL